MKAAVPVALCVIVWACSSPSDPGENDRRFLDYSLSEVGGAPLPGPASSLPGLTLWAGDDGSILTVAQGELNCSADGTAEESYLFRLSDQGSEVWDPIWVDLSLTCEVTDSGDVRFLNSETDEVLDGNLMERFDGCPVIVKDLPSIESLRAGYAPATSGAEFPIDIEFSGSRRGQFMAAECLSG